MKKKKRINNIIRNRLISEIVGNEQCKRCGEQNLHWDKIGTNWKLLN